MQRLTFLGLRSEPGRFSLHIPVELLAGRVSECNIPTVLVVLVGPLESILRIEEEPFLGETKLVAGARDCHKRIALLESPRVHDLFGCDRLIERTIDMGLFSQRLPKIIRNNRQIGEFFQIILLENKSF